VNELPSEGTVAVSGAVSGASGWTLETLKVYFEAVLSERDRAVLAAFAAQKSAVDAALAAADRAVAKAEDAAEKRFESVNEFRNTLKDQQIGLLTRTEAEAEFRALREKAEAELRAMREVISSLTTRLDRSEGREKGIQASGTLIAGSIAAVAAIVSIIGVILVLVLR
jgi:small-conductance mechanosensitive channel